MIRFDVRGILLDVEGTTTPISFVYDVMFPFVRHRLVQFLTAHGSEPAVQAALAQMLVEANSASCEVAAGDCVAADGANDLEIITRHVRYLMDRDVKSTGLKALQGLIWRDGFQDGQLVAPLFADVAPTLKQWRDKGVDVRIYSSGSVAAQQLFFEHTQHGDLRPWLSGYYDTTTGAKRQPASYQRIAEHWQLDPGNILFVSDVVEELDAASASGLATALADRPGNPPKGAAHGHAIIRDFGEIWLTHPSAPTAQST